MLLKTATLKWAIFCWMCCASYFLNAQHFDITRFSNRDGLAQTHCRSVEKDKYGRIWIGTNEGGVSLYSGQEFTNYLASNGLSHNFIYDIISDESNNLWIATGNGITQIKGVSFKRFLTLDSALYKVTRLAVVGEESIYFIDENNRVGFLKNGEVTFSNHPILVGKHFNSILYLKNDSTLWLGTDKHGIIALNGNIAKQFTTKDGLPSNHVLSFGIGKEQEILVGTTNGVCVKEENRFVEDKYGATKNRKIYSIEIDDRHRYWFGTDEGAFIYVFADYLRIEEKNGLAKNIYDLEIDNEGGVWFASDVGMFRLNGGTFATYYKLHGLSSNFIYDLEVDENEQIWVCSRDGLNLISNNNQITTFNNLPKELSNAPELITKDKNHNIYIGFKNHLFQYIPAKNQFKKMVAVDRKELPPIQCSIINKVGELLLGTQKGVYRVRDGVIDKIGIKGILDSLSINAIAEGNNGELWIGTNGQGLFKYAHRTLRQVSLREGLPSNVINSIYIDATENIWLGTSGSSLCKIPYGDLNRKPVAYEDVEFSSPNIYMLEADNQGNLWAGTDKGMNKIIILQNDFIKVETYKDAEGFLPLEVTLNASAKDKKGNIWVGTVDGLVRINPSEEVYTDEPPLVIINDMKLFYESANWSDYADGMDIETGLPIDLHLPYDQNHLLFRFVGVNMNVPSKIRYSWKLEGIDANWTPPSVRREAIYPNLPSGEYTFMVKAANARGLFSNQPTVFQFEIKKPFYYTRTFIIFTAIMVLIISYLFIRRRVAKVQATQETLRKKVRERTEEIEVQKSQIEAQRLKLEQILEEIEHKNEALNRVNQDIVSSINYAGRIQKAVFPSEEKFKKVLPESFIFSVPKRAVRGDFFWLQENKSYIYVALVDCTSTGVPAGFLSLIGHDYMSQLIGDSCMQSPSELLIMLHNRVITALHPEGFDESEGELNDGMDIAICRIDKKSQELIYAGARRPLLVVQNGELEMIKGSFSSIGISFNKVALDFENHPIKLHSDTTIYLFSEGFPNQFDTHGKKYKISRFRDFIASISQLPMEEQKNMLEKEYLEFKGEAEQFDDILVIGFRLGESILD
jgi:ligand-binding sensor domain-containing protein/serine phosphatase RsbU (regulator of sigma subunit)